MDFIAVIEDSAFATWVRESPSIFAYTTVLAFAINVFTGFVFIAGNPVGGPIEYLTNLSFLIKMLLVLIAGINVLVFYFGGLAHAVDAVPSDGDAPFGAKLVAGVSLVAWIGVIFFGRIIMYNDTLLYALGL